MRKRIEQAKESLCSLAGTISGKRATVGFDGCRDVIYRVLKAVGSSGDGRVFFPTMGDFGSYIIHKSGMSCSLELNKQTEKIGGNCPILSNALGFFGIQTNVVGTLGYPEINGIFKEMSPNCKLFSYAGANETVAMEFNDGKVLFSPGAPIEGDVWERIAGTIGREKLHEVLFGVDLIGLVNWSELEYSTFLWKRVYEEASNTGPKEKKQILFIDLSDCSRRDAGSIREAAGLMRDFGRYFRVVLSLNENEASVLSHALFRTRETVPGKLCKRLCEESGIHTAVIHTSRKSFVYTFNGASSDMDTYYNLAPQISTGAGDNFNAGFALGCLLELPPDVCEVLGNASSSYYLCNGHSPTVKGLAEHMVSWMTALK